MITPYIAIGLLIVTLLLYQLIKPRLYQPRKAQLCFICELRVSKPIYYNGNCFCANHYNDFTKSNWFELKNCNTSSIDSTAGIELYELKRSLISRDIPAYILCNYSEAEGQIITHMAIYVKEEDRKKAHLLSVSND